MKMSREELGRIHKEKCKELKQVRAKIAEDLGVDLHQTECTYEGYCSGTCPKCKSEEWKLNRAIMKRQLEEADVKRRVTAAGLTTMAALSLTGCNVVDPFAVDGAMEAPYTTEVLEGDVALPDESTGTTTEEMLTGEVMWEESTEELEDSELEGEPDMEEQTGEETQESQTDEVLPGILEGDIAYIEESTWELAGEIPLETDEAEAGE